MKGQEIGPQNREAAFLNVHRSEGSRAMEVFEAARTVLAVRTY
ncbi:MAG TPA: hypothetical protein VFP86_03450 [bacterium]|nr:hypothetical protein [bacterium]